jgi:hypothetical protein
MSEPSGNVPFGLTPRQRRLRVVTLILLGFIVVMIAFSQLHPFFHPVAPHIMTTRSRRALAAQYMLILGYYSVIFLLALSMLVLAWLYIRDIRVQLALARRDIWQKLASDHAEARKRRGAARGARKHGSGPNGASS